MMRFEFPVLILGEDVDARGDGRLGIRELARAIEAAGLQTLQVTSFGDVASFAQQQSRASAFVVSAGDDSREDHDEQLRGFVKEIRFRNADIPIFLYGETRTSRHIPNDVLRELHGFIHMFEDTPEFVARYIVREAKNLPRQPRAAVLPRAGALCAGRLVLAGIAPGTPAASRS